MFSCHAPWQEKKKKVADEILVSNLFVIFWEIYLKLFGSEG